MIISYIPILTTKYNQSLIDKIDYIKFKKLLSYKKYGLNLIDEVKFSEIFKEHPYKDYYNFNKYDIYFNYKRKNYAYETLLLLSKLDKNSYNNELYDYYYHIAKIIDHMSKNINKNPEQLLNKIIGNKSDIRLKYE